MIKTIALSSGINKVDFDPDEKSPYFYTSNEYVWIKNLSADTVYVSLSEDCGNSVDGTAAIAPYDAYMLILDSRNAFYAAGSGSIEVHTSDISTCPFKISQKGGDVSAEGSVVQLGGLQGGVPFSEVTVKGKNLLPVMRSRTIGGLTYTSGTDGSVTVTGTQTAANYPTINTNAGILLSKGDYALSGGTDLLQITAYDIEEDTVIARAKSTPGYFTLKEDKYIRIYVYSPATSNGLTMNEVLHPQLEYGDTATEYAPPITGQELTVTACGKNLLNNDILPNGTYSGLNVVTNADGSVTVNGTNTSEDTVWLTLSTRTRMLKAGTYTLSGCSKWVSSLNETYAYNIYQRPNGTDGWAIITSVGKSLTFTCDDCYIRSGIAVGAGDTVDLIFEPQIEVGSTATPYEPYSGADYTITPDSNPYTVPTEIYQQDGVNTVYVTGEGEPTLSVKGIKENAAVKRIWDKLNELTTAVIVSNGEI
ncbi:MAG: hypothetical protein IJ446_04400 [Oscillospiraceae bacterium]|nr:hypothetical protein [Oscillospiraceae bacterium]